MRAKSKNDLAILVSTEAQSRTIRGFSSSLWQLNLQIQMILQCSMYKNIKSIQNDVVKCNAVKSEMFFQDISFHFHSYTETRYDTHLQNNVVSPGGIFGSWSKTL